jgi:hypothetical protein
MANDALKLEQCYRTKSGTKYHRQACRFARKDAVLCQNNPTDRKLAPCGVCKPQAAVLPMKSVGKELGGCLVCLKDKSKGLLSREAAIKAGFHVTKTGAKYHVAGGCKRPVFGKPEGKAAPKAAPKVDATAAPKVTAPPTAKAAARQARKANKVARKANLAQAVA